MTKQFVTTSLSLCLMLLVGCSSVPPQPILVYTESDSKVEQCSLTPCPLPALLQPKTNEDWISRSNILETELKLCATQVLECIKTQQVKPSPLK